MNTKVLNDSMVQSQSKENTNALHKQECWKGKLVTLNNILGLQHQYVTLYGYKYLKVILFSLFLLSLSWNLQISHSVEKASEAGTLVEKIQLLYPHEVTTNLQQEHTSVNQMPLKYCVYFSFQ